MLNPKAFGLTAGIMWAICMFIMTLAATFTGYDTGLLTVIQSIYPGYTITVVGSFIGALYGFIDGFIGLYIFAWLYNKLAKK